MFGMNASLLLNLRTVFLISEAKSEISPMAPESGKCYGPAYPENGYISKTFPEEVYNPGHTILFHCLSSYEIIGNPKLVCLENGSWSHTPPTCKREYN